MPFAMLLALSLALPAAAPSPQLAVDAALAVAGGRAELAALRTSSGAGCHPGRWEALKAIEGSGQVALRFDGRRDEGTACEGFAWAKVRVLAPLAVTTRAVREGEPLLGAVSVAEREVVAGRRALTALPEGAVADRPLPAGALLDERSVRLGPQPGDPITVTLRSGALVVEQPGRAVPCSRGRVCASLPSGRRVEGRLQDGRLLVEVP